MSLRTANGTAELRHTTHEITSILEVIAFAMHPGSSENTTTLCFMGGALLVTSQNNLTFQGLGMLNVKAKLDALQALALKVDESTKKRTETWWNDQCALSKKIGATSTEGGLGRTKSAVLSTDRKIKKIKTTVFASLMKRFFDAPPGKVAEVIEVLSSGLQKMIVVLDVHIFTAAFDKTGFHGESRVLRYLFIDWARSYISANNMAATLVEQSRGKPEGSERLELINYMEREFLSHIRQHNLMFGSSQGTCTGCCDALDICHAARGPKGNRFKQWLDPLDLSGSQGGHVIARVIRKHALNFLLVNIDNSAE